MKNIFEVVQEVLSSNNKYLSEDNQLLKAKVYTDVMTMDKGLLTLLLSNERIEGEFFTRVKDTLVFDKQKFAWLIESKEFLPDSYTRYSNKIGLSSEGNFISQKNDVVLDFPYKDCFLQGGQDKEDQKREEIFYHETIASDEVTRMLAPKIFTNAKRYTEKGVEEDITFDEKDNLIIKGNNLIALSSLLKRYEGKVKCIYIDPPFNTGHDSFKYNDRYNRSTWLTFMENRLSLAKKLLKEEGLIWINLDHNEAHYCKVLADEIYGEENFMADITWQSRKSVSNDAMISVNTNHILCYAKYREKINRSEFRLPLDEENYRFYDEEANEHYRVAPFDAPEIRTNLQYEIVNPNTQETFLPPEGRHWVTTEEEYLNLLRKNRIKFGVSGEARPQLKVFLSEDRNRGAGKTSTTLWSDLTTTTNATQALRKLNLPFNFNNPKPEELIQRIVYLSTKKDDIVLDFFMGSGTTQAVAHKMNRQYIGIEQMDYIETVSVPRLQKVIEGEQGGVSKDVNWKGGGSFVYCELLENSHELIKEIQGATNNTIDEIKETIYKDERIVPYITRIELEKTDTDFEELNLEDKKKALIALVDKNKLYVNLSDIEDETYGINDTDRRFTESFYKEED